MRSVVRISIVGLGLAAIAAGAVGAQEPAVTGACAKPDSVAFRGNTRVAESALRGDVPIVAGAALNYRTLQRAIKNLYATAQFDDIQVKCEVGTGRVLLAFELKERPLLGEVDVRGPDRVSAGTVRDQVDILIGRPIDPSQVARVLARIDSLYATKGYYLAQTRAETTQVAAGTRITFVVDEGNRLAVSGIQIAGNQRVSDRELVSSMQTKPEGFLWWRKGEFDDDKYTSDLTEKIPQAYAKHGLIDVQVLRDTVVIDRNRGKALVDLVVTEGPQYVVGDFEVNGARRFSSDEIRRFYPFTDRGRTLKETVTGLAGALRPGGGTTDPPNVFDATRWVAATQQVLVAYM
jgi:outer membrane protein insertion porin family